MLKIKNLFSDNTTSVAYALKDGTNSWASYSSTLLFPHIPLSLFQCGEVLLPFISKENSFYLFKFGYNN
jgi:hypothetical protein